MRAEILIRRAKFDDAEQHGHRRPRSDSPSDIAANFLLATVQSNKGELEQAGCHACARSPTSPETSMEVTLLSGVVKLGIGQHAQAETLLCEVCCAHAG